MTATEHWIRTTYNADVSVVIVNYNACAMLERTLDTLFRSAPQNSLQVIVVDNASRDGSVAMVRDRFPQVQCVPNEQNVGLVQANNQGMALAEGRHLLLLNNDTIIYPGMVDILVRYLNDHPAVGAAGPKVLNIDGSLQGSVKNTPTPMAALFGRGSVLTRLFPWNPISRRYLIYMDQDFCHPFPVGSASLCALMVKREALEKAGPLDPRYFVYWCDVDWCRAFWESGFEVHCVPDALLTHDEHKGGTRARHKKSLASVVDFHHGAYLYYRKWEIAHSWDPRNAVALVGLSVRALVVLATEQLKWTLQTARKRA